MHKQKPKLYFQLSLGSFGAMCVENNKENKNVKSCKTKDIPTPCCMCKEGGCYNKKGIINKRCLCFKNKTPCTSHKDCLYTTDIHTHTHTENTPALNHASDQPSKCEPLLEETRTVMKFFSHNVNGIQKRAGEVFKTLEEEGPWFFGAQELRYLNNSIMNDHIQKFQKQLEKIGYKWIVNQKVALIYKKEFKIRSNIIKDDEGRIVGAEFEKDDKFITVVSCYAPTAPTIKNKNEYKSFLSRLNSLIPTKLTNLVCMGDFNMDYNRTKDANSRMGGLLNQFLYGKNLCSKKTGTTYTFKGPDNKLGTSTLDYIFTTPNIFKDIISSVAKPRREGSSDHNPICYEIKQSSFKLVKERRSNAKPNEKEQKEITEELKKINLKVDNKNSGEMLKELLKNIKEIKEKIIKPKSYISYMKLNSIARNKLKDVNTINVLIHELNIARKINEIDENKLNELEIYLWDRRKELNNILNKEKVKQKVESFANLERKLKRAGNNQEKLFFQVTMPDRKNQSPVLNNCKNSSEEKNAIHKHYEEIWKSNCNNDDLKIDNYGAGSICEEISWEEMMNHIKMLKKHKSGGPDGTTNEDLLTLPENLLKHLLIIFNNIIKRNDYPEEWKESTTVLIPKTNGNTIDVNDTRPISLMNCTAKLYEAIISGRIRKKIWNFRTSTGISR